MLVCGALLLARICRASARELGDSAGPSIASCVERARFAAALGMFIGVFGAATPRSKFAAAPTPATPMFDRDNAIRDGSVAGDGVSVAAWASIADSTLERVPVICFEAMLARTGERCEASLLARDGRLLLVALATACDDGCKLLRADATDDVGVCASLG